MNAAPWLPCIAGEAEAAAALPLHGLRPAEVAAFLETLPPVQRGFIAASGFTGEAGQAMLVPSATGGGADAVGCAIFGLGLDRSHRCFGDLPLRLPASSVWRLVPGDFDPALASLGFCLGAYHFARFASPKRAVARLDPGSADPDSVATAAAIWFARDLINTPANLLGPRELAEAAAGLARAHGASCELIAGEALAARYPVIETVGAGSARPPVVAILRWAGSAARQGAPHIALVGKGVCFDTGGYDLKPSSGMIRMKKDMGGAAATLALAQMVMQADLPVTLTLRIGCAENSVSGSAMRPSDVVRSRGGMAIEIGNTDAEGRLVLCDLLAEASAETPAMLLDFATLTGAARVALGPDLPALFSNDDDLAASLLAAGAAAHDPLWRLPLWPGYDQWLDSRVADINTISSKPMAGAIVAGLFLQRFIAKQVPWAHIDTYGWNDQSRPAHPEGGEAPAVRAAFLAIKDLAARQDA
jgi:leucyl aminopeptidase